MIQHAKTIIGAVQKHTEKERQLQICFSKSLPYFQGHFPGVPILPGIVQLNIAIDCAAEYLLVKKTKIQSIPQIKFLRPIQPDIKLLLALILEENLLKFSYRDEKKIFSHGKIVLENLIT